MTSEGMPIPEWVGEVKSAMFTEHQGYEGASAKKRDLPVIEHFSNLFAEYEMRGDGLLIHVFPRRGEGDRYYPCEYKEDGTYIPSRLEEVIDGLAFPNDIVNSIKKASDVVWQGDIATEKSKVLRFEDEDAVVASEEEGVPPVEIDMQSYAVQFQDSKTAVELVGITKFVDQFCGALDSLLD